MSQGAESVGEAANEQEEDMGEKAEKTERDDCGWSSLYSSSVSSVSVQFRAPLGSLFFNKLCPLWFDGMTDFLIGRRLGETRLRGKEWAREKRKILGHFFWTKPLLTSSALTREQRREMSSLRDCKKLRFDVPLFSGELSKSTKCRDLELTV